MKKPLLLLILSPLLTFAQSAGVGQIWTTVSGTLQSAVTANGTGTPLPMAGLSSAVFTVNCNLCSGGTTVTFQATQDGSNWTAVNALLANSNTIASSTTTAGIAVWEASVSGYTQIRASVTNYSAGTITVTATASAAPSQRFAINDNVVNTPQVTLNAGLPAGSNTIGSVTESGAWTVQPGNTANTTPWLFTINQGSNAATVSAGGALKVDNSGVTQPVSAASLPLPSGAATAAKQPALGTAGSASADVLTVQGVTSMTPLRVDGSAVTQPVSGTVTANAGTGTFNNQQTSITSDYDSGAGTQSLTMFGVALPASGGAVAGGTSTNPLRIDPTGATTQPVSGTVSISGTVPVSGTFWQATQPVSVSSLPLPSGAAQDSTVSGLEVAQASTTSGQNGTLIQGAATTAAPTYTTGKTNPLSLTTGGLLRVDASGASIPVTGTFWQATQPVSGTFWQATQPVSGTVTVGSITAGSSLIGEVTPVTTATTTDAATTCYLTSAATTNSTNCKASAGNVYGVYVVNTTTTNYFLRMYNASSAPTCSSATGFIEAIPALGAAANGGGISRMQVAQAFSTGIGFCLTGGGASTDNTSAATGVYVTILYK